MAAHTARFDEQRNTIDDQYPVALQQFFSPADWSAFVQEINGHGEQHNLRCQEIAEASSMGLWLGCLWCICCCGPCLYVWKHRQKEAEAVAHEVEAVQRFEAAVKRTCVEWQERFGNTLGVTLKSEEAQRMLGPAKYKQFKSYRKCWVDFIPMASAVVAPPTSTPIQVQGPGGQRADVLRPTDCTPVGGYAETLL